jgi:TRAP-type C4-dicarboxylate transport system substrate-binding protein
VRTCLNAVVALGVALAVTVAAAGCTGAGDDRAGGKSTRRPVTLTLAHGDYRPTELEPFVDEVARLSGGMITIKIRNQWLGWPWRRRESGLIRDVAAGKADLGSAATRAWHAVGVTSFEALQAPLLVDSYALEESVVAGEIANEMLDGLEPLGVVGIGILPGPMRKLLSIDRRLAQVEDFERMRVGITESRVGREAVRALGATAVSFRPGTDLSGLDAVESHVDAIESNRFDDAGARHMTANLNLWPRALVVFMNKQAFGQLEVSQRDLLREALRRAIPETLAVHQSLEREAAAALCRRKLNFVAVAPADMTALRQALSPVYRELERDRRTRSFIERIRELREEESTSAEPPPSCLAAARSSPSGALPNGTYTNTTTAEDARRAQIPAGDPIYRVLPLRHRLVLESGDFVMYDVFADGDTEVGMSGTYSVYRDRIVFRSREDKIPLGWSFEGKTLRFDDEGEGGYFGAGFTPPFTKIG